MSTVILVRHGRSTANTAGILAGRIPGVTLDDTGLTQADTTAARLTGVPLAAVVSSPLERCRQTAAAIMAGRPDTPFTTEDGLLECDYGDWQNRKLSELNGEDMWKTVISRPSEAVFPGGESMAEMQRRSVGAVRRHDAAVEAEHGPKAVWVAVSHGDIIKSVIADAYGMDFDHFQRVHVNPASVSVISYTEQMPHVHCVNTEAGDLSWLKPRPEDRNGDSSGVQVGGGAGH